MRGKEGILENAKGICYNAGRQNEVNVQLDRRKALEVATLGLFYSVKWFNLSGWLPYSSSSSHLQM